jgi:hypothetical protein
MTGVTNKGFFERSGVRNATSLICKRESEDDKKRNLLSAPVHKAG